MKPGSETQVLIPPALATELQAAADEEHRPTADVVRDALEAYLEARRWRLSADKELARARRLGLPDDDVPLTEAHRQTMCEKIAQGSPPCARGREPTAKRSLPGWKQNSRSLSGKGVSEALHSIA
jgi:predicted transcriptional regulator